MENQELNQQELNEQFNNEIYVNAIMVKSSLYEFNLMMGRHIQDQKMMVQGKAILSPQAAKELLRVLKQEVEAYEEKFGEINLENKAFETEPQTNE